MAVCCTAATDYTNSQRQEMVYVDGQGNIVRPRRGIPDYGRSAYQSQRQR